MTKYVQLLPKHHRKWHIHIPTHTLVHMRMLQINWLKRQKRITQQNCIFNKITREKIKKKKYHSIDGE